LALAVRISAAIAVVVVSCAAVQAEPSTNGFVVTVGLTFDGSVSSGATKAIAREEAADIWRGYGVEIAWDDDLAGEPALHLEVIIAGAKTEYADTARFVLGRTDLDAAGMARGPIRVNSAAIEQLLDFRVTSALLRERELGRALGRVLAHEIGHALLGLPSYHDPEGLMRVTIPVDDLIQPDRRSVQLTDTSVNRLRDRMACLSRNASAGSCTCVVRSGSKD
jgi:hypothetical protein